MIVTRRDSLGFLLLFVAPGVYLAGSPVRAVQAQTQIVADWRTGLTIHGYDPVAYFAEAAPVFGLPKFEHAFGGAVWRFRNAGNRAAFIADPAVYVPRFGGYDPIAMARGVAVPGNPSVWLVFAERLYLFHGYETREAFRRDPRRAIAAAAEKWPGVMATLLP